MTLYLWVQAFHIVFVIALMAGLLIYPRYKLHQLSSNPTEPLFETMKEASNRLRKVILNPALILVWVLGLTMLFMNPSLVSMGWMHVKLVSVLALTGMHGYFTSLGKKIDRGDAAVTPRRMKMLNEVPFLIMIGVVLLAVLKPF